MNINEELNSILLKYGIIQDTSFEKAVELLNKIQDNLKPGEKIGLYGVGIEAEGLLKFIMDYGKKIKIDQCFDKDIRVYKYESIILNTYVKPIEAILNMSIDYIILGSYRYRGLFKENLISLGYQGKIIDLYEYIEDYILNHYADYEMVYNVKREYLDAKGSAKKELLNKLIKEYLLLKDFKNSYYYIDSFIANYPGDEKYSELKVELSSLLEKIRECIAKKKHRDIVINWIDALSYYDIPQFPFLYQKGKEGICFENAYTVMPWTTETLKSILFGEYPIEGKLFLRNDFSENNTRLLKLIKENGYEFAYCGQSKIARMFDKRIDAPIHYYETKYSGSMQKQWDALDILCKSQKPVCVLIHTLRETHGPYVCGECKTLYHFRCSESDWEQEACKQQAKTAGKYIDEQLSFYWDYYKENSVVVYMSDHGRVGNNPMNENKIHVMLTILENGITHHEVNNLFSLINFWKLLGKIIKKENDWESLTDAYVLIENLDSYSEIVVEMGLNGRLKKDEIYQCRGIVTATDSYYLYATGKEHYFKHSEPEDDKINNIDFAERISRLKQICGKEFIDIYKYDKFRYSRLLYNQ